MSERLTDEELAEIGRTRFQTHMGDPPASVLVRRMMAELRERRAADLTPDEVEALRWARVCVAQDMQFPMDRHQRALAILDRLTGSKP